MKYVCQNQTSVRHTSTQHDAPETFQSPQLDCSSQLKVWTARGEKFANRNQMTTSNKSHMSTDNTGQYLNTLSMHSILQSLTSYNKYWLANSIKGSSGSTENLQWKSTNESINTFNKSSNIHSLNTNITWHSHKKNTKFHRWVETVYWISATAKHKYHMLICNIETKLFPCNEF